MKHRIQYLTITFLLMFLFSFGILPEQTPPVDQETIQTIDFPPISAGQPPKDINNLTQIEAFLDEFIPKQLDDANIAGMTISIVHNDTLSLAKGYGYSDIGADTLVEANSTLFRIGSISKMFTWTAIMQLYEQGKVDLHTDINTYLPDFQIAYNFDVPITLTHLMTHTAGFEETMEPIVAGTDVYPELTELLLHGLPPQHFEPGTVPSYSNFGTALAGYIVEKVSNTPFNQYVEDNIFHPLNMTHSSFRQPLPSNLSSSMSKGHYFDQGELQEGTFEYLSVGPAGSMSSTAVDIGHFMIAQLNNGSYQGTQILQPETATLMQTPQFTPHEDFPSIRYGFYDINLYDQISYGHGGDTVFFHSQMSLFPNYDLGLFVSYNTVNSTGQPLVLQANFMKEFMQTTTSYSTNLSPIEGYETRVKQFTGYYDSTRVPYSTPDKLYYEMYADQSFELTANDQGQLIFFGMTFLEIEENLFQDTRGYGVKLFFADNEQGQIKYLYINDVSVAAYEKLNWYEYSSFQLFLIIFISSIFGLSLLFWIVEGIVKFVRKKKQKDPIPVKTTTTTDIQLSNVFKEKTKAKWVINWPRIIVLGQVILSGALVIVVDIFHVLRFDYSLPYDNFFDRILIIPFFILLFVVATLINAILEWGGKNFQRTADQPLKIGEKIHFSIVALTGVAWIWLINYWNFLGYKSGGIM